jgi:hypothetical protein
VPDLVRPREPRRQRRRILVVRVGKNGNAHGENPTLKPPRAI